MIDWLNSNSGAVNAILAAILVVITGVYAFLTRRLVLESKELREMTIRPSVVVTAEIHEIHINIINLRVENIGGGAARNIRLRTSREFMIGNDRSLNEVGFFKQGIPLLGPGRNIETFLANGIELNTQQESFEVTAEYEDANGWKIDASFLIDFAAFDKLSRVDDAPLYTIAQSIKKLQESIGNLSNGMRKLPVVAYSLEDLDAERSARNLSRNLRRVSPERRKEIENLIEQEIARQSTESASPPRSAEGE